MFKLLASFASISVVSVPVCAQVIDIGVEGEAVVYTSPTVFIIDRGNIVAERDSGSGDSMLPQTFSPQASVAQVELEYGLPPGLVEAVIYQESRGRMNAVSPKGALGLMQLMPGTAALLGVNPYDADDNIRGGARYLRQQIDRFGSIPLALAAYNAGPGAVLRFGGIPPFRETQNYVTSILGRWKPPSQPIASATSGGNMSAPIDEKNIFVIEVTER